MSHYETALDLINHGARASEVSARALLSIAESLQRLEVNDSPAEKSETVEPQQFMRHLFNMISDLTRNSENGLAVDKLAVNLMAHYDIRPKAMRDSVESALLRQYDLQEQINGNGPKEPT